MRLIDYYVPRDPCDRDEITHVDLDAQTPLPARLPTKRVLPVFRALVVVQLLLLALAVMRGCGR